MLINPLEYKIIELRNQGFTYHEISQSLDCPLMTVQKTCFKNNIAKPTFKLSDEKIAEIKKVYAETKSQRKTAEIVGVSRSSVAVYGANNNYSCSPATKVKAVVDWRRRTKQKLVEYKGGCCQAPGCGYNRCVDALTFHHLDPSKKDFQISGKSWSYERLKEEVDKCMLLCANCHKEVHAGIIKL